MRAGKLVPIPFQVDERLPDGRFALPDGPHPIADDSPGMLDRDDELLMMISDLGDRASSGSLASRPNAIELALADPLGGAPRYAYLAAVDNPRRSPLEYLDLDPREDRIETDNFRIGFTRELPTDFAVQTGRRSGASNLLDRSKLRVTARVLKFFRFTMNEDDLENHLLAWHAGPIRVIRSLSHSVNVILGIHSPQVASLNLVYRDFVENPYDVHFSWVPHLLFDDVSVRIGLDFTDLAGYLLSWSGMRGLPITIGDAAAKHSIESLDPRAQVEWIASRGNGHTIIQTFAPNPDFAVLRRELYFRDDPVNPAPPERVPGEHPGIGYLVSGWENLSRGKHVLDSLLMVAPEDYNPEILVNELAAAPTFTVAPVEAPK